MKKLSRRWERGREYKGKVSRMEDRMRDPNSCVIEFPERDNRRNRGNIQRNNGWAFSNFHEGNETLDSGSTMRPKQHKFKKKNKKSVSRHIATKPQNPGNKGPT